MTELRVIEICAGAGGQALGLERAGFEHELAIELDDTAVKTLKKNRPKWDIRQGDVADITVWNPADYAPTPERRAIDLLAGGVPCPPFSIAGKQLGANDERDLFAWAVEQVGVMQPRALLLENVRGLSMPRFAGYRQHVLDRLDEFGYSAAWKEIQASRYGVPQLRPRFVLIAMQHHVFQGFEWPEEQDKAPSVGETLRDMMKRKKVFGDDDELQKWVERAKGVAPTIVGGSKKHGGADLGPTRAKLAWKEMGVDGHGLHDDDKPYSRNDRSITALGPKLTPEMVARLQGWNDGEFSWEFEGRKTAKYRQIGNAFPPPVAKALGLAIANALKREELRSSSALECLAIKSAVDPIYRALRDSGGYMTVADIANKSEAFLNEREIVRRIDMLSHDFEIEEKEYDGLISYRLGGFRAFTGQHDHSRHESFEKNRSRIS
ncbi:DNA (cytosine-5-)-methyltransferase [Nocardia gipuzkoensis]|uniref:DNA cytosine methyltransferase n=1 Tax=Nocardia gipuzkoensis TaxID=2749991 RepID=UPI001E291443|nr:DNA (cytosine-5-)-methyltransferase [Nocardia gipuzkoensis]UGT66113.1 DNA (cytosine-5-)-methyltransferase [Nocardia gipuzkoensis]